jgi:tRNA 5-methylaminomethyl-2-thiouridine biosynthesis bifunctional protein
MVGALPQAELWMDGLSKLRTDAKWKPERAMCAYRRVMINIGHGSRGLTSTPLAARILLQQITGQDIPADNDIPGHVNPARFLIRALKRNQI